MNVNIDVWGGPEGRIYSRVIWDDGDHYDSATYGWLNTETA